MFKAQLGVSQWVQLPFEIRQKLVTQFGLKRSGGAEVFDGKLKSDGYTEKDLLNISVAKMQELTGSKSENFYELFDTILGLIEEERVKDASKAQDALQERTLQNQLEVQDQAVKALAGVTELVEAAKRKGRPPKK